MHGRLRAGRPSRRLPTIQARSGHTLYLHGSQATGYVRDLPDGAPVRVTVTLVDGLVLARSAFHHSLNYRSAVVHGTARRVTNRAAMLGALETLVQHVMAGRWPELRPVREDELRRTNVLAVDIDAASAKVRSGPVVDDDEADVELPIWAGVVPLAQRSLEPEVDESVPDDVGTAEHVMGFHEALGFRRVGEETHRAGYRVRFMARG